ncbi:NAD(P)H-binding protein [Rhodohalobacter halophilus]|uniref:NAD(P)H-binding protein n=1 Tax=Rhodohalobacter halophilus TaxID=1812810 RepID=UPI00083FA0E5|nr:NAD(P)H-binding protein [Rhodohalobacter halophilus]
MTISILGCGWLGFPLAQNLLSLGFSVKGSTTSEKKVKTLKQAGIETYLIKLPEQLESEENRDFWNSDILFLNIPPSRGDSDVEKNYPTLIQKVVDKATSAGIDWIIFASSTSVYSSTGGVTDESDAKPGSASRPSGEAVLRAEQVLQSSTLDVSIIRFGGLYGYGRHPVKYLAGRKDLSDASKPVNLIHQTDCLNIIQKIIELNKRNDVFNAVSDGHPPRKEFYISAAHHFNLPEPQFSKDGRKDYRVISNEKVKRELEYTFSYPNPMDHTP